MSDTHDTIDGLLAEFRGYAAGMPPSYHVTMSWADFRRMLDRFDAAHRREVATTKESLAVGNSGDCAKLREALLQVIRSMELESGHMCTEKKRLGIHGQTQEDLCKGCRARNDECWTMTLKRECEAALAAPPRNCDRFASAEEAWNAYDEWVESYRAQGKPSHSTSLAGSTPKRRKVAQMAETHETIANIIAEKRVLADRLEHEMAVAKECKELIAHRTAQAIIDGTRREADRLDAAHKREITILRDALAEVVASIEVRFPAIEYAIDRKPYLDAKKILEQYKEETK